MKKIMIALLSLVLLTSLYSQGEIISKYYNTPFSGGREKMVASQDVKIESAHVVVHLFDEYSEVKVTYNIENKGNDTTVKLYYPKIDTVIFKTVNKGNATQNIIKGDYRNFNVFINQQLVQYQVVKQKLKEINLPYRQGDTLVRFNKDNKQTYFESIDAFSYNYVFYVINVPVKHDEVKEIEISYNTPHYYNEIIQRNIEDRLVVEDPGLNYMDIDSGDDELIVRSEKIFNYQLFTSYSEDTVKIERLRIDLYAHIVDQKYLKVFPANYKHKGKHYYWNFKNFKAKPVHNIIVKILPEHSGNCVPKDYFTINPSLVKNGYQSYYLIDKKKDGIELAYLKNNPDAVFTLKGIRIAPPYYKEKTDLNYINKPLMVEIEIADNKDYTNSVKIVKKIRNRKINRKFYRKSFYTIFKSKGIAAKYIKIRVLKSSNDEDEIQLGDIQILE